MKTQLMTATALLALACSGTVHAETISFSETETFSGTLNGVNFTNQTVTFTVVADTTAAMAFSQGGESGYTFLANPGSATVTIGTMGPYTLTDNIQVIDVQSAPQGASPEFLFYDFTNAQGQNGGNLLVATQDSFFSTYNLQSDFSPITNTADETTGVNFGTSGGDLMFTAHGLTSTAVAVPEPSSIVLIGLAGGCVLGFARTRRAPKRS